MQVGYVGFIYLLPSKVFNLKRDHILFYMVLEILK